MRALKVSHSFPVFRFGMTKTNFSFIQLKRPKTRGELRNLSMAFFDDLFLIVLRKKVPQKSRRLFHC